MLTFNPRCLYIYINIYKDIHIYTYIYVYIYIYIYIYREREREGERKRKKAKLRNLPTATPNATAADSLSTRANPRAPRVNPTYIQIKKGIRVYTNMTCSTLCPFQTSAGLFTAVRSQHMMEKNKEEPPPQHTRHTEEAEEEVIYINKNRSAYVSISGEPHLHVYVWGGVK